MNDRVQSFHVSPHAVKLNLTSRIDGSTLRRRFVVGSPYYRIVLGEVMRGKWDTVRNQEMTSFFAPMDLLNTTHKMVVHGKLIDPEAEQKQDETHSTPVVAPLPEGGRVVAIIATPTCWRVVCRSGELSPFRVHDVGFLHDACMDITRLITTCGRLVVMNGDRASYFFPDVVPCPFCEADNVRDL